MKFLKFLVSLGNVRDIAVIRIAFRTVARRMLISSFGEDI